MISGLRRWLLAVLVFGLSPAHAAQEPRCDTRKSPWVRLVSRGKSPLFTELLRKDIQSGLSEAEVCEEGEPALGDPAATLEISPTEPHRFTIEVRDAVTNKRVGREVDLRKVPEDGRAVALAFAAAELVRAAWAELLLTRREAPPEPEEPRSPEASVIEATLRTGDASPPPPPPAPPQHTLTARVAAERFGQGLGWFGGDVLYTHVSGRWALGAGVLVRGASSEHAPGGTVSASAFGAEPSGGLRLLGGASASLWGVVSVLMARVQFRGNPSPNTSGSAFSGVLIAPRAGLRTSLALSKTLHAEATLDAGYALASVIPEDTGQRLSGAGGHLFGGTLGLSASF